MHGAAGLVAAGVLLATAQPLFAEDTWLHLALGRAYATSGPWLAEDPLLFTAAGPPDPSAWLGDLALHGVQRTLGFQGLRVLHVLLVASILATAWSLLRSASGSRALASGGTALFAALAAYRLFQLRPHLVTVLATFALVALLLVDDRPPSWRRVALTTGLFALWANLHGAFLLGLALLGAAVAGLGLAAWLDAEGRGLHMARARRLAAALALGLLASLANPAGARQHLLYFAAGAETPALEVVSDEWAPFRPFELPVPNVPPSALTWAVVWGLGIAGPGAVALQVLARRRTRGVPPPCPALLAVGATSLLAMLSAVRLLWLGLLPLLVIARSARALGVLRPDDPARPAALAAWVPALATLLLVPAFFRVGAWPMISRGVHPAVFSRPYPASKWHAHAVWFLCDAELEGRLWNDYHNGNFLSYWLAPRLRAFVNGSLNVPIDVMRAGFAIRSRRGDRPGESFADTLDRLGIDVFVGTGAPSVPPASRPQATTTTHLEGLPGWILAFRSAESSVYLRKGARNRENLERARRYYAQRDVPFDPERGLDPERALRAAPGWAEHNGLAPVHLARLEAAARAGRPAARERLASVYALIGLYERAAEIDRTLPRSLTAARRLVWSLLHQGRGAESREAAERLARIAPPQDGLSRRLVETAERRPALSPEVAAQEVSALPLFTGPQLRGILAAFREPEARSRCPVGTKEAAVEPDP